MDHTTRMRGSQRLRGLNTDLNDSGCGKRLADQIDAGRPAVDILHHQEPPAAALLQAVNRADVRMVQGCRKACLLAKSLQSIRVPGESLGNELHSDGPAQLRVLGFPHFAHRPEAGLLQESVVQKDHTWMVVL